MSTTVPPRGSGLGPALGVGALTFLTRLPFLGPGLGNEPDCWRLIRAGRLIAQTGAYHQSRSPGHPVQEYASALWWNAPLWVATGATALLSAIAAAFFYLTLRRAGSRSAALPALAFALTPAVYVHSVDYMDYMWGVTFSLVALYFAVARRPLIAGLLIAVAAGCRIEYAAMAAPIGLLAFAQERGPGPRFAAAARVVVTAGALTALLYVVPVLHYGTYVPYAAMPMKYGLFHIARTLTADLWGLVGLVGVGVAVLALLARLGPWRQTPALDLRGSGPLVLASLAGAALYLAAFFPHPHKVGYLIPPVPFLLVVLSATIGRRVLAFTCACLMISSFLCDVHYVGAEGQVPSARAIRFHAGGQSLFLEPFQGIILSDHKERGEMVDFVARIVPAARRVPRPSVIVAAGYQPHVQVEWDRSPLPGVTFADNIDSVTVAAHRARGVRVFYVPGVESDIFNWTHTDLKRLAEPLPVVPYGGK